MEWVTFVGLLLLLALSANSDDSKAILIVSK